MDVPRVLDLVGIEPLRLEQRELRAEDCPALSEDDEDADVRDLPGTPESASTDEVSVQVHNPIRREPEGSRELREVPDQAVVERRLPRGRDTRQRCGTPLVHLRE